VAAEGLGGFGGGLKLKQFLLDWEKDKHFSGTRHKAQGAR
jgi:hypothetical protein